MFRQLYCSVSEQRSGCRVNRDVRGREVVLLGKGDEVEGGEQQAKEQLAVVTGGTAGKPAGKADETGWQSRPTAARERRAHSQIRRREEGAADGGDRGRRGVVVAEPLNK